jgi:SAM-dependent methyltransferase
MSMQVSANREIWNRIFGAGHRMWYPSEALVRLVRRHEKLEGFPGTILDHGCGSGVCAEFLVRSGHRIICSDVSVEALRSVARRFNEANLAAPDVVLIDVMLPLRQQLPVFDHLIAWQSIYYNTKAGMQNQMAELIEMLPHHGTFIVALPTIRDAVVAACEKLPDGTRRMSRDVSGQGGALLAVPESRDELLSLCGGIDVRDVVTFGMTFGGETNEYVAVYGVKR